MRIEWLEAFLTTVKTKSLTKASESLHMSQPALSKQIRKLEEDIGAELFIRSAAGVELTNAGEILLKRGENIVKEVQSIRREIALSHEIEHITIGTWPSLATSFVPYKLANIEDSRLQKKFNLKISHSFVDLIDGLQRGEIDVALFDDSEIQHSFFSKPLFTETFKLFINSKHPLAINKNSITFNEIKNESFVVLPPTCDARLLLERSFRQKGEELHVASEIDFGQSILGFISANLGMAILPAIFENMLNSAIVKAIQITDFNVERSVSIIARSEEIGKRIYSILK
ncbi:MAG: LysR family transcriptional regulator [Bacillota bacterium]|nr:LysR family transcriptional regulator [Bacillota bacterium]